MSSGEREALEVEELRARIAASLAHARANAAHEARQALAAEERDLMRRDLEGREAERRRVEAHQLWLQSHAERVERLSVGSLLLQTLGVVALALIALALWGAL